MTTWAGVDVTHCGIKQTFTSALPTLLKLSRERGKYSGILGCKRHSERFHPVPAAAKEITDLNWSVCPMDLLDSPWFRSVQQLNRMANIAPISGWPDRYAAWAVSGLITIRG